MPDEHVADSAHEVQRRPLVASPAVDKQLVWNALRAAGGRVEDAALALGMTPRELLTRLSGGEPEIAVGTSTMSGTRRALAAPLPNEDDGSFYNPFGGNDEGSS